MKKISTLLLLAAAATGAQAQIVSYSDKTVGFATSQPNSANPIFGQALNMVDGGVLNTISWSVYNSGSSAGSMLTATSTLRFYDNTVAYTGGSLTATHALLGAINFNLNFGTGLLPGYYTSFTSSDLSAFNIVLPKNVFVTQQFTQTAGTSTRNGVVGSGTAPTVGTNPNGAFYMSGTGITEGLYTVGGAGNLYYEVKVTPQAVPEPATMAALGLGAAAALRRRKK